MQRFAAARAAAYQNRYGNVAAAPFTPTSQTLPGETPGQELKRRYSECVGSPRENEHGQVKRQRIEQHGAVESAHAPESTGDVGSRENQRRHMYCLSLVDAIEFDVSTRIFKLFDEDMDQRRDEWALLNRQLKTVMDTLCRLSDLDVVFARKLGALLQPRAYSEFTVSESQDLEPPISSSFRRGATTPSAGGGAAAAGPAEPPANDYTWFFRPWSAGAMSAELRLLLQGRHAQ